MKKILFVVSTFVLFFFSCDEYDTIYVTDDYYSICQINSDGTGYRRLIDKGYKSYSKCPSKVYFIENDNKILIVEDEGIKEFDLNSLTSNYYYFDVIKLSALSRDRSHLAIIKNSSIDQDIYIFNINSKTFTRVTNSPTVIKRGLSFSNDGLRIVYSTSFSSYSTIETVSLSSGMVTELARTNTHNIVGMPFQLPIFNYNDTEVFYFSYENRTNYVNHICKLRSSNNYVIDDTSSTSGGLTLSGPNDFIIYNEMESYPWRLISHNITQNVKHTLTENLNGGASVSVSDDGNSVLISSFSPNEDINLVNINGANKRYLGKGYQPALSSDGSTAVFIFWEAVKQ